VKKPAKLGKAEKDLIAAAQAAIRERYRDDWQEVGAALRTRSGKIFTGVNLDAYLGGVRGSRRARPRRGRRRRRRH
jgi:cytidine deaminase